MKTSILYFTVLGMIFVALFMLAGKTFAAVRCETQYGGGQVCVRTGELQINKKVVDPDTGELFDNLSSSRFFAPGREITFRLFIKNVGDEAFSKVQVTDTLPAFLEKVEGDLSFEISDLTPGETEERTIKTRVVSELSSDSACAVNTAEAVSGGDRDRDTAQVCVEKKVLGVTKLPPTGPKYWFLILPASIFLGLFGIRQILTPRS